MVKMVTETVAAEIVAERPYRKRKGEGHVRREEILAAARSVFLEDGYDQTTIRKIAARAGVSATALYLYFQDKDAVLLEICDRTFQRLIDYIDEIERHESDPLKRLSLMMECYLRFGLDHPDEYKLTFVVRSLGNLTGVTHRDDNLPCGVPGVKGPQGFRRLMDMVSRAMTAGYLKGNDPVLVSELIWASGHGLVSLLITHTLFPFSDRERLIAGLIDMQLNGLLTDAYRQSHAAPPA